jgi:thiol-disulfide isomerase/thioredoxin
LFRSLAHHLAGDEAPLPIEGRLAPFKGATSWLNSEPLTPEALKGRVVLVDFWTYTCVNWLRTLPYVRAWARKYRDAGLTVIGAHTPEFGFEHDVDNVRASLGWFDVDWPVAVDSDYGVWRAFDNHYWPAVYLADADGNLRYHHFGEGEYVMTEMAIQQLLAEAGASNFDTDLVMVEPRGLELSADWRVVQSGETYLGYGQASGFANEDLAAYDQPHQYTATRLRLNEWALTGNWTAARHAALLNEAGGRVAFRFRARDVNLVMAPATKGQSVPFRLFLDGQPAGSGVLSDARTYQLIRQSGSVAERTFEIEFEAPDVEVYCFTFG